MNTYYSSQKSIDHNQYVLGNLTYQSNYYVSTLICKIRSTFKFYLNVDWTELIILKTILPLTPCTGTVTMFCC